jgi:hypothetical protein
MKLCHKVFIECFSVIRVLPDLLSEEEGLGAHTGVVVLSPSIGIRYFWCNRTIRPCGDKVSLQCPNCLGVKTIRFSGAGKGRYNVKCLCQWAQECDADSTFATYPDDGNGWGKQMLYGTDKDFERVWSASRESYNLPL